MISKKGAPAPLSNTYISNKEYPKFRAKRRHIAHLWEVGVLGEVTALAIRNAAHEVKIKDLEICRSCCSFRGAGTLNLSYPGYGRVILHPETTITPSMVALVRTIKSHFDPLFSVGMPKGWEFMAWMWTDRIRRWEATL